MDDKRERLNVLLVEDSEDDRFFFRHAFERADCDASLFTVQDGIEAIEFLKTQARVGDRAGFPDFIFLDLKMPECDGFDVLRWMKDNSVLELTKVFVLSGSSEPQDIQLAKELGACEYLVKPVRFNLLRQILRGEAISLPGTSSDGSMAA
ncbi:MAG TPA: response regulator [Verrucomicrobiae bacterium]|nr:response regulator [Verrucomicrobiae bacterium]